MTIKFFNCSLIFFLAGCTFSLAQQEQNQYLDSLFIAEEENKLPPKVLHAEPLYIDLIRDLGARKGEREWNLGMGLTDNLRFDTYQMLLEYEWAPINRLGLEVEIPFTFYASQRSNGEDSVPGSRMESIKTAFQWSFFVSEKMKTTMALGYINEVEFMDLNRLNEKLFKGNIFNPFFIAAKRFGNNWHSLIYTGPRIQRGFGNGHRQVEYELHTNFHYMITGTRNFVGIEFNKTLVDKDFDMVIRPQMRVGIAENFLIGIVGGIPVHRENQRFSMFTRIIWEPKHK